MKRAFLSATHCFPAPLVLSCCAGIALVALWANRRKSLTTATCETLRRCSPSFFSGLLWCTRIALRCPAPSCPSVVCCAAPQMKILTTAVFSVLLMGRTFHSRKWRALVLLVLGATLVSNGSYVSAGPGDETDVGWQYVVGVAAVLTEVCDLTWVTYVTLCHVAS